MVEGVDVIFDDDDIVVVDKPVGVAAHPSLGWSGPDVLSHLAGAGFDLHLGRTERQGIVQRLDVGTSGLMVVAKSEIAYTILKRAFRSRAVDKTYHALVRAIRILRRHHRGAHRAASRRRLQDGGDGERPASITHYDTLEAFVGTDAAGDKLETGRTHQIRVHLAAIKHPCAGDLTYGADPVLAAKLGLERQWLHAAARLPAPASGEELAFASPYPLTCGTPWRSSRA